MGPCGSFLGVDDIERPPKCRNCSSTKKYKTKQQKQKTDPARRPNGETRRAGAAQHARRTYAPRAHEVETSAHARGGWSHTRVHTRAGGAVIPLRASLAGAVPRTALAGRRIGIQ